MLSLVDRAIDLALRYHDGQRRKYNGLPYVTHPLAVAMMVAEYDARPYVLAAAVCHNVLEDTDCTQAELIAEIGEDAKRIVKDLTNYKILDLKRAEQKAFDRKRLATCGETVCMIKACDRLHNLSTIDDAPEKFQALYVKESELLFDAIEEHLPRSLFARVCQWRLERMVG